MKNFKEVELEELRLKILDALHSSKEFWITHRDNTYGLASILNLIYKKSYFEVLFFTKYDVTEKGLPPLKIYTPIKDEVDFSEIISNPDYDEDGLISPKKVIKRMKRIIRKEFQKHLSKLDEEVELLDEYFENYPINNNPYHRKIRISFNDFAISLKLNFERYPMFPSISFSQKLSSILSEKEFSTSPFVSAWDSKFPRHIIDIIDKIMELISLRLKIDKPSIESQYLILNNVSIGSTISDLNFKVLRGRSIGILFDEEEVNKPEHSLDLLHLFESISGSFHEFMGTLKIFGKDIQDLSSNLISKIFILPPAYDTEITSLKLKKALRYNINFDKILKEIDEGFKSIIAFAEIDQKLEFKIASLFSGRREIGFRKKKRIINNALDATGLRKKKNKQFIEFTPLEFLLFSIARALIQIPSIIMFSIPFGILGKFDYEKFNAYMDKIKKDFHVILIFHGPEEIISNCDKILTVSENTTRVKPLKGYIEELPQLGEVITIELAHPQDITINKLRAMSEIDTIIEERKAEKYKLFLKDEINSTLIKITELFGSSLYSFKRSKASIKDYLEFMEFRNYNLKTI